MRKYQVLLILLIIINISAGQDKNNTLTLKSAVEIGLKKSPEMKSALAAVSASKGRFWNGVTLPQPEIGLSYDFVPNDNPLSKFSERTIEIKQSFEFPSNYFVKGSKFNKEEEIALYKLRITERAVICGIKSAYYKSLAKKFQLRSSEENLLISEDFYKKTEIRQNVGEGTNLEKLTAKVQYTEAQNNIEISKNDLLTANTELRKAMGLEIMHYSRDFELIDSLNFIDYKLSSERIYKLMEESNPQIKIAELEDRIASDEKILAWSSLLPNFNLSYYNQMRDGDKNLYGASFGISVPLWFMFDQRGKIQEANANQTISESRLQLVKNEVWLQIKSALNSCENNLKQVKLYLNDVLPLSEEIHRTAIKSFAAGELTYMEYLQAKQTLVNSRNNYINALLNYYQSLFQVEEIVGQNLSGKFELEK